MTSIADRLAWLGGADLDVLQHAPHDRGRFAQMGGVLLTTAGIAAISMTFAIHNTMSVPVLIALLFGIGWGLVILNLDRFLVVSMGSIRNLKQLLAMAIPRLLLAIVVSAVISTPITLEIFRADITRTIGQMNLQESQQNSKQEVNSDLQVRLNAVTKKITNDQSILNGNLPATVSSPQVQAAQTQVNQLTPKVAAAFQAETQAYEAYQCELYGNDCAKGSGKSGFGPIAQAKKTAWQQDVATYNSLNGQLTQANAALAKAKSALAGTTASRLAAYQQAAKAELPGLLAQQSQLKQAVQAQDNFDQSSTINDTGLLRQLQALFKASSDSAVLTLAHLTVAALFFLIELLPVIVKLLLNLGKTTTYEQRLKTAEEIKADAMKQERKDARRKQEREADEEQKKADAAKDARVTQALDMAKRQQDLGLKANKHVADKMEDILNAALTNWSNQVQASLAGGLLAAAAQQQSAPGQPAGQGQPARQRPPAGQGQPAGQGGPAQPGPASPGQPAAQGQPAGPSPAGQQPASQPAGPGQPAGQTPAGPGQPGGPGQAGGIYIPPVNLGPVAQPLGYVGNGNGNHTANGNSNSNHTANGNGAGSHGQASGFGLPDPGDTL